MQTPLLELDQVSKRFGYRTVLKNVTTHCQSGEFILLLGNNGSGKSTLLKIISSLSRPSSGNLQFQGADYRQSTTQLRHKMGMVSHESRLYGDLNAEENLRLFGTLYGVTDLHERVETSLQQTNLMHARHFPVRTFSSGMLKRLSIARVLMYRPSLLLLDEPFTGLDHRSVEWFRQYLAGFHHQGGTIILATHQVSLILDLSQRLWLINDRKLHLDRPTQHLTPQDCYQWMQTV